MRIREAKDLLVAQAAEQAALEGMPLSDLEKRMMYFTEGAGASEDPIKLNEEFEAQYDSDEYEAKISRLLHHAYQRLRKENAVRKNWDLAIRSLRRGDHYLLVMWDSAPSADLAPSAWTPVRDSLKLLASALGIIALAFLVVFISEKLAPQRRWLQEAAQAHWRILFGIFITIVLAVFFFPRRVGIAVGWLLDKTIFRFLDEKEGREDSE